MKMSPIKLSAGTIEYQDTGGEGPVLVLLQGLLMDASSGTTSSPTSPSITGA